MGRTQPLHIEHFFRRLLQRVVVERVILAEVFPDRRQRVNQEAPGGP